MREMRFLTQQQYMEFWVRARPAVNLVGPRPIKFRPLLYLPGLSSQLAAVR